MKYWRLKVTRPLGIEDDFDLRAHRVVHAGDDGNNEICIETTSVPAKLKVVSLPVGKENPIVQLSDEVADNISGDFIPKKYWKDRLYRGRAFEVRGETKWQIENAEFCVYQTEEITLTPFTAPHDKLARKHMFQSFGMSASTHILLLLLLLGIHFVMESIKPEPLEVQKVSIQQIDELFNTPEPEPEPVVQEEPETPELEPEPVEAAKETPQLPGKKRLVKKVKKQNSASAKGEGIKKPNVESLGLLALQSAKTNATKSLSIKQPKVVSQVGKSASAGVSLSADGLGIRSGTSRGKVAKLDQFSGGSYQTGELGTKIASAGTGPSIRLVRKEIEIRGGLDPAIIQQIIEERLAEVRYCYETALLKDVNLTGKIATSWTIQPDGSVGNLSSDSPTITRVDLHNCLKARIKEWKFPQPKGGGVVHVKYPFVFSSLAAKLDE